MSGIAATLFDWCTWVENLPFSLQIAESSYYFPLLETAHVIGLALVFGTIAIVDLRLLDLASRARPVRELIEETLPFTWIGFAVAFVTGGLMFVSRATEYYGNVPFRIKLVLLALAGANMLAFHFLTMRTLDRWSEGVRTPRSARLAGGSSIALWIGIVFTGRWIAFA